MRVELRAIELAKQHFEDDGWSVTDVSRMRGHNGYDFIVQRDNETLRVEVKGCSRPWQIPDLFETEFDEKRVLIADLLCVVYLVEGEEPFACLIPRSAIPPDQVSMKIGYRISSRLKKRSVLEQYARPLSIGEND